LMKGFNLGVGTLSNPLANAISTSMSAIEVRIEYQFYSNYIII